MASLSLIPVPISDFLLAWNEFGYIYALIVRLTLDAWLFTYDDRD